MRLSGRALERWELNSFQAGMAMLIVMGSAEAWTRSAVVVEVDCTARDRQAIWRRADTEAVADRLI